LHALHDAETDELRVRFIMGEIQRAFMVGDAESLDRILAPDFTFTDPWQRVISKENWLRDIANGDLLVESVDSDEFVVRHVGDSLVVSGRLNIRAHYTKGNYNGSFRYMGVYEKVGDEWKLSVTAARR
jgi:hypothetical protein